LQYFSLGKGGEFRLVDNLRGKIYPELYKQIQNVYQFEKDPIKRKQLNKKVKDKYDSFIAMVFKTIDTNYKLLLDSGEIILLEDLEE